MVKHKVEHVKIITHKLYASSCIMIITRQLYSSSYALLYSYYENKAMEELFIVFVPKLLLFFQGAKLSIDGSYHPS